MIKTATLIEEDGTRTVILLEAIEYFLWYPNSDHSATVFMKSGNSFGIPQEVAEELEQAWIAYLGDYQKPSPHH